VPGRAFDDPARLDGRRIEGDGGGIGDHDLHDGPRVSETAFVPQRLAIALNKTAQSNGATQADVCTAARF
jgi:hypothetical protein